jgi:hypothetical protein
MVEGGKEVDGRFRVPFATTAGLTAMREQIQARLETLKQELQKGQAELQKVEAQRTYLHEAVLRISGAAQVLEELLTEGQPTEQSEAVSGEKQPASAEADGPTTGQLRARQFVR